MHGWHALGEARRAELPRVPFRLGGVTVGSVAAAHLEALRAFPGLEVASHGVALAAAGADAAFARINAALREQGLVRAWRDETYPVPHPQTLQPLARFERAASRFWGTLTFGAHATGYVPGADGRPRVVWIAQRSFSKATDPGLYDNLIGGGVPADQQPAETLVREGWEEAGLQPAQLAHAVRGSVIRLSRDIPEGFQWEELHAFDIALPEGTTPHNQDGEVHAFMAMPVADALALAMTDRMTVDAALVTLDFAWRHGFVTDAAVVAALQDLRVVRAG